MLRDYLFAFLASTPLLMVTVVALLLEHIRPVEKQSPSSALFNMVYTIFFIFAQNVLAPIVTFITASITGATGWGLVALPTSGWGLIPGILAYLLVMDFAEYIFHRAQHSVPILWAMHSFHHSDTTLNASSIQRHFWLEQSLKAVTVFLLPAFLFKANPIVLLVYLAFSMYNVFTHMNIRIGLGRWWFLMNSPQYHRVHHSMLPEHYNCNFVALFPIFDILFGTYRKPLEDEYPPTGIEDCDKPTDFMEAILWPLRSVIRKVRKAAPLT